MQVIYAKDFWMLICRGASRVSGCKSDVPEVQVICIVDASQLCGEMQNFFETMSFPQASVKRLKKEAFHVIDIIS